MSKTIVQCTGLHKSYLDGRLSVPVLSHIDFSIEAGARIAIVEADGSDAVLSPAIDLPAAARCTALVHLHQLQMD